MARFKPKSSDPNVQQPKDIAVGNFSGAVDQIGAYESLAYSLAAHRVNVGDTIVEYYGKGNVRALHDGLRSYDRQVKKLWKELRAAVKKVGGGRKVTDAGSVLDSLVEAEFEDYYSEQLTSSGPDRGRYTDIETEANPLHTRPEKPRRKKRKSGRKKPYARERKGGGKKANPGVNVRSLVAKAMK